MSTNCKNIDNVDSNRIETKIIVYGFFIILICSIVFSIFDHFAGDKIEKGEAMVVKEEFKKSTMELHHTTGTKVQTKDKYIYTFSLNDKYTKTVELDQDLYNVKDKIKVDYMVTKYLKNIKDLRVSN